MFEAHGSFDIKVSGRILLVNVKGGWNIESAHDYSQAAQALIKPLFGAPWAVLAVMDEWELFTPDCSPVIQTLNQNAYRNGLVREAMVNQVDSVKLQAFPSAVEGFPQFERQIFRNKELAFEWLKKEGFEP
jgi:hypothetical protein